MYVHEVVWGGTNWIDLAQNLDGGRAVANAIIYLRIP